ncbi:MAG: Gfo/Idh/MocA family oxidoreductase [Firmicutes bacterium]|nr:Gfo/Idh/MocA family oxidoreductase [Bacillota bacterium]MCL2255749.1 Gfo/Idh/MocA family oxidoreductase [Bacillota bacterium]
MKSVNTKKEKIKFAIVGLGRIQSVFLDACNMIDDIEVVLAASSDIKRAQEFAKTHGITHACTYEELYRAKNIDAVYVGTNMHLHAEISMNLLKNKIPVLCEKSLCLNENEAKKMISTSKKNKTLLMEAMWTRFLPSIKKAKEIVASGKLGQIKSVEGAFSTNAKGFEETRIFKKELGGGCVLDIGVYPISLTHHLLGVPKSVDAKIIMCRGVDVDMEAILKYDAAVASLKSSFIAEKENTKFKIICEYGVVTISEFFKATSFEIQYLNGSKEFFEFEKINGFVYQINHFLGLLKNGKIDSNIMPLADSQQVMKIMDEVRKLI